MTTDTTGGVWANSLEVAASLGRCGLQVDLATLGSIPTREQVQEAGQILNLRLHPSRLRPDWLRDANGDVQGSAEWLLDLEGKLRPDVVHLNHLAFGALPFHAPRLVVGHSCLLSRRQALREREAPAEWSAYRALLARGLAGAHMVVAPTSDTLRRLDELYGVPGPTTVIPNGRSSTRFKPSSIKEPFVLSVGGFWDEAKNLRALDDAASGLPWCVQVAGPLERPAGSNGHHPLRASRVRLLGPLSPWQLADRYSRASIYALPSRYEPFGLTVVEAALAGCALVLGDIPSLREGWDNCARFVDPEDPGALREAVRSLIDDPAERLEVAFRARAQAMQLSPDRQAARYLEVYARLLEDREARPGDRSNAETISQPARRRERSRASQ